MGSLDEIHHDLKDIIKLCKIETQIINDIGSCLATVLDHAKTKCEKCIITKNNSFVGTAVTPKNCYKCITKYINDDRQSRQVKGGFR